MQAGEVGEAADELDEVELEEHADALTDFRSGEWKLSTTVAPPSGVSAFRAVGDRIAVRTDILYGGSTATLYRRSGSSYVREASPATFTGAPLALSATRFAVTTIQSTLQARVAVYRLGASSATFGGYVGPNFDGACGTVRSVSLGGDTLFVGCSNQIVRAYEMNASTGYYALVATLRAPDVATDYPVVGIGFGSITSANANTLLVSMPAEARLNPGGGYDDHYVCGPGRVHVYQKSNGAWTYARTLVGDLPELVAGRLRYRYGEVVEISATRAAIQVGSDTGINTGHVQILDVAQGFAQTGRITTSAYEYIGFSERTFIKSNGAVYEDLRPFGWTMTFDADASDLVAAASPSRVVTRRGSALLVYDWTPWVFEGGLGLSP